MRWGELDHVLVFPDELEEELDQNEQMQRGLTKKRLGDLVRYLTEAEDHFFSALTLIILPRDIARPALEADEEVGEDWDFKFEPHNLPDLGQQRLGKLTLTGDVRLFPADGQHRSKSAMKAMRQRRTLSKEEVPVVLVPYQNPDAVRQMFSDLNLNAKPVNRTIALEFENRDPTARIAKEIAETVPLFRGRVNRVNNSLPKSSANVITLNTLGEASRRILQALAQQGAGDGGQTAEVYQEFVRNEQNAVAEAASVFETIIDCFTDDWERVLAGAERVAGELRDEYLFPHGLAWQALSKAAAVLIGEYGDAWEAPFRGAVAGFDWRRTASEWRGNAVIHNEDTNRVNNTGPAINDLAEKIISRARS